MPIDPPFLRKTYGSLVNDLLDFVKQGIGHRTRLSDATEGSVVRTLMEAFARELAVAYEQLESVYQFGFIDTATGAALDNVVAILGVRRRPPGYIEGVVRFSAGGRLDADLVIPVGTLVSGRQAPLCETTEEAVIRAGQSSVDVPVRSQRPADEHTGKLDAEILSVMPRPIAGIVAVTNQSPLLAGREETDEELRARARHAVDRAVHGTRASILQTARSLGVRQVTVRDDNRQRPGEVEVVLGDIDIADDLVQRVAAEIDHVRPAGIRVRVVPVRPLTIKLQVVLAMTEHFDLERQRRLDAVTRSAIAKYFDGLGIGQQPVRDKIHGLLSAQPEVAAVTLGLWVVIDDNDVDPTTRLVTPTERAKLDTDKLEVVLEPPAFEVVVDMILEGGAADAEKQRLLRTFTAAVDKEPPGEWLRWSWLVEKLKPPGDHPVFVVTHRRDGSVAELRNANHSTRLDKREKPILRHIGREGELGD